MILHRTVTPFLIAAAVAIIIVGTVDPAKANITGATITTTQPSYTGTCPVTIGFTGSITGSSGTVFTYSFNRYINNGQQVVNGATVTMPASGTYAVKDSIPISSSTSPATFDQIWVHNIASGQADVYSLKANFAVTCETATATPNKYATVTQAGTTLIKPVLTLNSLEWTWRTYTYKFVGFMSTYVPEFGTGPCTDLCIGWLHLKNGDSAWLYHFNRFSRGWLAFANTLKTAKATKATLTVPIISGDPGCLGGIGMAKGPWHGVAQHDFPTASDADFSRPTSFSVNGGNVVFDVTSIVQAWESGFSNDGFVIRSRVEDNGSNGNDSCTFELGTNGVLTIQQ